MDQDIREESYLTAVCPLPPFPLHPHARELPPSRAPVTVPNTAPIGAVHLHKAAGLSSPSSQSWSSAGSTSKSLNPNLGVRLLKLHSLFTTGSATPLLALGLGWVLSAASLAGSHTVAWRCSAKPQTRQGSVYIFTWNISGVTSFLFLGLSSW